MSTPWLSHTEWACASLKRVPENLNLLVANGIGSIDETDFGFTCGHQVQHRS